MPSETHVHPTVDYVESVLSTMPLPDGVKVESLGCDQFAVEFTDWRTTWLTERRPGCLVPKKETVRWAQDWPDNVLGLLDAGADADVVATAMYEAVAAALAISVMHEITEFARRPSDGERIWVPHPSSFDPLMLTAGMAELLIDAVAS